MGHKFTIQSMITNIPFPIAKQQMWEPKFHEKICRLIPATNLNILKSSLSGSSYVLIRSYNLDVNIPDIAKKLLKDAFRIQREDHWDLDKLNYSSVFSMNMPGEFRTQTAMLQDGTNIQIRQDWDVIVNVPFIHGLLAKHAESEIRRFHQIELEVIQKELSRI